MKLLFIRALVAAASCIYAQLPRGHTMPSFSLLQRDEVRRELRLTKAQVDDVEAALAPLFKETPSGGRGIFIHRDTNLAEYQAKATKSFTPEQKRRLEQIDLWFKGGRALLDPQIAQKLKLSEKQVQAIDAIGEELDAEVRSRIGTSGGRVSLSREHANRFADRMLQVLTPAQRKAFDVLRGKPFQVSK